MSSVVVELLIILSLVLINGIFALSEIVIVSSRRARLQERAEDGDVGARVALELAHEPTRFLSTVQIGITLVGILAGVFGGATITARLAAALQQLQPLAPYREPLATAIVVIGITILSLLFGELIPKRVGLTNPEGIASLVPRPMRMISILASPVVSFLSVSTEVFIRLLRLRPSSGPPITEDELRILLRQGTEAGVFEEAEEEIVAHVLELTDRDIGEFLTPRTAITWLDLDDPLEVSLQRLAESPHALVPVGQGSLDTVVGILATHDLARRILTGEPIDLRTLLRPPLYMPASRSPMAFLHAFRTSGQHLAIVLDEYGGVVGLVTLTDIVESIVGELVEPGAEPGPQAVQRDDGSWLVDGLMPISEFKELLDLDVLPDELEGDYHTVGGLAFTLLGHVPAPGEHARWNGWQLEVVDMDGNRIDKVLVSQVAG
jgi:putative hemolysin